MSRLVSPTQRKALEALDAGGTIHVVNHSNGNLKDSAFLVTAGTPRQQSVSKTISTATVDALHVQGWLVNMTEEGWRWRGSRYVISDKGREQLRKERADEHARQAGREKQ